MVNPRAFDGEIRDRSQKAVGGEKAFLVEFANYWKAVDGLAVSLDLQKDLELSLTFQVRGNELPKPAQRFFRELGKASDVWRAVPDNALFAIGARIDVSTLSEAFAGFCDRATRDVIRAAIESATEKLIGRGNLESVASGLGPDWGFWITPPDAADKSSIPQGCFALKISSTEQGKKAEAAIIEALDQLLVIGKFSLGFSVERTKQGEIEVRSIRHEQVLPAGLKPSFAAKNGYLLVASSPSMIQRFELRNRSPEKAETESPMLRMSARSWESYLTTHRKELAELLARPQNTKPEILLPRIEALIENLKSFDQVEITVRSQPDQATIILRLRTRTLSPVEKPTR
jgi:hypothetical protein